MDDLEDLGDLGEGDADLKDRGSSLLEREGERVLERFEDRLRGDSGVFRLELLLVGDLDLDRFEERRAGEVDVFFFVLLELSRFRLAHSTTSFLPWKYSSLAL